MVRYQEWEDGLHNFNDKVILTLHFCLYLRNCLQTHTALGRAIETWELTSGQQYPNKNSLIHGYLHFEALTEHDYNFSCVRCGHHPPVVVMDLHKSCVFSLAVSELEDPPDGFDGEVDIDEFWDSLCLERIARGFVPSDKQNPFAVKPTYHHWAPWIGPHTRKSNKVHAIRKLCRECGIDSQGSKMELVLRLREEMKTRSKFDKIFQKVWGASDFARGLAVHANLREPETIPFSPHEGRLLDPSHENLQYASNGGMVNLPWLNTRKTVPDPGGHPLTGSADHYCLYDTFHEGNTKDPKDILRRIKMVPELAGRINSQVAEQLFSTMKKNNYYMNMLSPSAHVFMMRNVIHNYNQRKNEKIKEELKKLVTPEIQLCLNEHGQAEFCTSQPTGLSPDPVVAAYSQPVELSPDPVVAASSQPAEMGFSSDPDLSPPSKLSRLQSLSSAVGRTNPNFTVANWKQEPNARLCELLDYVLDIKGDPEEEIVQANNSILTRSDFWTLGLERDVEATIANCCFNIIAKAANARGIATMAVDAYVVVTWLPPYEASPIAEMICDFASKDVVLLPAWQPGHWTFPAGLADTPISPSPSPHVSRPFQSLSCPSGTPITEDSPFLPLAVLQRIIEETLSLDMAMLGVFNRVSKTFRELAKPFHPSVYINESLAGDLKLNDSLMHVTVRKIYKTAGRGSGLALRLKGFSKRRNWPSARLVLRHMAYGRYLIEDVCLP
ncbi:hypothetical protein F2P79_016907 [Pimephales promelas]|nr:hypothetical protein F2P79_016907 [Pimephales promelas]